MRRDKQDQRNGPCAPDWKTAAHPFHASDAWRYDNAERSDVTRVQGS